MSMTRNALALAGVCAVVGLGIDMRAQQPPPPPAKPAPTKPAPASGAPAAMAGGPVAVAKLSPTKDSTVRGEVTFTQTEKGVQVVGSFTGMHMGEHGFHIHEKGDCSAPDGASAGGHFNPTSQPHAARDASARHAGDLGNLKADPYGMARANFVDDKISLTGTSSIIGRAVIVHEKPDDYTTQPTGNAGGRQACGVIEAKK